MSLEQVLNNPEQIALYCSKLNKKYFPIWFKKLKSFLDVENMSYVIYNPFPMVPPKGSSTWSRHAENSREVSTLILSSMSDDVPKEF